MEPEQALQPVLGHDAVFDELDPFSVHPVGTQVHVTAEVDVVEVDVVDVDVVVVVVVVQLLAATALHVYVPQTDLKYELNDFDYKIDYGVCCILKLDFQIAIICSISKL